MVQFLADDGAENGIAEKFEPFVTSEPLIGHRSMGEGLFQQVGILEMMPDGLLTFLQRQIACVHNFRIDFRRPRAERALSDAKSGKPLPPWANGFTANLAYEPI